MITASLTAEHVLLEDGTTAYPLEWHGEKVLVRDDAMTVLEIIDLYQNKDMDDNLKGQKIILLMFADPSDAFCVCNFDPDDYAALIEAADREIYGIEPGGDPLKHKLWDFKQDAAVIRTSFRIAYGIDWDQVRHQISWIEMLALIASVPHETPLGQRIYYRNPKNKPKRTKYNREQVAEFDRLHKLYSLTHKWKGSQDRIEASQHAMDDLALSMKRR